MSKAGAVYIMIKEIKNIISNDELPENHFVLGHNQGQSYTRSFEQLSVATISAPHDSRLAFKYLNAIILTVMLNSDNYNQVSFYIDVPGLRKLAGKQMKAVPEKQNKHIVYTRLSALQALAKKEYSNKQLEAKQPIGAKAKLTMNMIKQYTMGTNCLILINDIKDGVTKKKSSMPAAFQYISQLIIKCNSSESIETVKDRFGPTRSYSPVLVSPPDLRNCYNRSDIVAHRI